MRSVTGNRRCNEAQDLYAFNSRWWLAKSQLFIARSVHMLDIIMLAIALGFFALSVGYAVACDRL